MTTDSPDPTPPAPETAGTAQIPPTTPAPPGSPPVAGDRGGPGRWRRFAASPVRVGLAVFLLTLLLVALPLGVVGFALGALVGSDDERYPGHCRIHDRFGDRFGDDLGPGARRGPWNLDERPGWQRMVPDTTPTPSPSGD